MDVETPIRIVRRRSLEVEIVSNFNNYCTPRLSNNNINGFVIKKISKNEFTCHESKMEVMLLDLYDVRPAPTRTGVPTELGRSAFEKGNGLN
jgi:hypothetical protein